jgi:Flp pilus assembly protein TadG
MGHGNPITVTIMPAPSIVSQVRRAVSRFPAANQGNIAVLFGIALLPILTFMGAAIDYTRVNKARSAMQAALDSTALMLAKDLSDGRITVAEISAKATAYFTGLYTNKEAHGVTITANYTASSSQGSTIQVNGSGNVTTEFMKVAGFPKLDFNTSSTSAWGSMRMRVALALDVTGSMDDDGKMVALKPAAKSLIDQLSALAKNPGDVYVSIIPFAKDVNVGKSNRDATWINWSEWDDDNQTCSGSGRNQTCTPKNHTNWNGCVTDRDQNYDTTNTAPNINTQATLFPAEQYDDCPAQLIALTYDWTALNNKVDGLFPAGNTNQTIGLQWAFQSLTAFPFVIPAKDPNYKYSDVIVLVTDGLNTENRFSTSQSSIDARETLLCTNIKAAGITIYTVFINTGGDPSQAVLKTCASTPDKALEIKSASQVLSAFNSIGTALSNLRIAQ